MRSTRGRLNLTPRDRAARSTHRGGEQNSHPSCTESSFLRSSLTRCSLQDLKCYNTIVFYRSKSTFGSPDPIFYSTVCGPEQRSPGGRSALLGAPGGSGPAARVATTVVSSRRNVHFHKTVRSADRLVALSGRSNLIPRLRGEVDLRGQGGGAEIATLPYGIAVVEVELTP